MMHILFIDESGTPPSPDQKKNTPYFVLGGVIIPEQLWHDVKDDLDKIKNKYSIQGEIKWRFFAPNGKKENTLSALTPCEKESLRSELYSVLNKYKSIKTICVITDIQKAYNLKYVKSADDIYWLSYKRITERFQYYLQDISKVDRQKINGIVICDHRGPQDDKRLREVHAKLLDSKNPHYSSYLNLIEGVFIAPSHLSVGIQFADMVAGGMLRKTKDDDRFFLQFKETLRTSNKGKIEGYGLVKFPK
ncbi:DUF3800 domain-containing protein [Alphaproteobacteria bacterium]|nr:DUF3800 domain-containing protein [Alphaproteobacteria bacterium]